MGAIAICLVILCLCLPLEMMGPKDKAAATAPGESKGKAAATTPSESSAAKRARVESLRQRLPYVSQSALACVLREASRRPLPTITRRETLRKARREVVMQITPFGPLLQNVSLELIKGGEVSLPYIHPMAFFHVAMQTCVNFAALIARVFTDFPCSLDTPWHLAGYTDEAPVQLRMCACVE